MNGAFKGALTALPISLVVWGVLVSLLGWRLLLIILGGVFLAICFAGAMAIRRG